MTGKFRYGISSIKLRVSVFKCAAGSVIEIAPVGDDVLSRPAQTGTDRLLHALDESVVPYEM